MHGEPQEKTPLRRWAAVFFPDIPRRPLLIGTHHKTGTVWMKRIFLAWAGKMGVPLFTVRSGEPAPVRLEAPAVYFDPHSQFEAPVFRARRARGLHLIRDPRDVIISAAHYHARRDNPEAWLHRPRPQFAGLSYSEALLRLDPSERLRFEMENQSALPIKGMVAWNRRDRRFLTLRYEDLFEDVSLARFRRAFRFLGLRGAALTSALEEAWTNSLFSGLGLKRDDPACAHLANPHVRSGAVRQWEEAFTRADGLRFRELFGDALIRLGYETDHSWIDRLRA